MTCSPFDLTVFRRLVEDVGSFDVAFDFALSFLALLPTRIKRIDHALAAQDRDEVLKTLLGLKASAAMIGATQIAATAAQALAHKPVEAVTPAPLRTNLELLADVFGQALAKAHHDARTKTPGTNHRGTDQAANVGTGAAVD